MTHSPSQSPLKRYGIVFVLAFLALLVALAGAAVVMKKNPPTEGGIDRSAHDDTSTTERGLDAVTKQNVEDTSMTVN